jgi:PAS domain S-box-containing protein
MSRPSPLTDACLDAFLTSAPAPPSVALGLLDRELRFVKGNALAARLIDAAGVKPLLERVLASGEPVSTYRLGGTPPGQPGVVRQWVISAFPVPAAGPPQAIGFIAAEEYQGEGASAGGPPRSPRPPRSPHGRSEAELLAFVEQAPYGIYYSSMDGRFLSANPALVRMLDYESEAEVLALSLPRDVYVDAGQRERLVAEYARTSEIKGVEVEWRRRDGRSIVVRLSGRPLRDEGDAVSGFAMIAEDVTEQRRMSRALAQAQKMEAIGQLTSGIAHDFNNLLTVILAHAKFIADELPLSLPEAHEDLTALRTAARQGAELVHKVLALSRNESLAPREFDLGPVAQDAGALLRRILPANIRVEVTAPEPVPVHADSGAVQQILLNLATNARDAMPQGGELSVAVRRDRLGEEDHRQHDWIVPGEYGCLEVRDTGTGMDANTLAHALEPFFTTKPVGVGTGLGLAMVYGLVKQLGGFVLLRSAPGDGTTASIYLPLAGEGSPAGAGAVADQPEAGGRERILLLEDDPNVRRVAERLLAGAGYRVRSAADAQSGLALYAADPGWVDLWVSDVTMPGLDGIQLYEELRRRTGAGDEGVKMLLTSGYVDERFQQLAQSDSGVAFLLKPWNADQLLRTVRAMLDGVKAA